MENAHSGSTVCGGTSREFIDMECSFEELFARRMGEPPKQQRMALSNEQEWFLWLLFDRMTQGALARDMKIGRERVRAEYDRLAGQGGPKGERPTWAK